MELPGKAGIAGGEPAAPASVPTGEQAPSFLQPGRVWTLDLDFLFQSLLFILAPFL